MSAFDAIRQGTDLQAYARALTRTHDAVLCGAQPRLRPRVLVERSWRRVLALGLDPHGRTVRTPLHWGDVERLRQDSPLGSVIDEIKAVITTVADASQFLLVVTNGDGVVLWREGAAGTRIRADRLGFVEGAVWTEPAVGTNAIGTAIAEAAPVQLFSAEHFEQPQHPWYCTAAPIHDPRTGDLLGIVDVSGPALTLHPTIGALIEAAVRLAELRLWRLHQHELDLLRTAAAPWLAAANGPLLLVDEHGCVAHSAGIATRERIARPRGDRAITIPGLGLCLPEAVAGGWLVRPRGTDTAVRLLLDLSGPPLVEVSGSATPWRSALTVRHTEILLLLHLAGPAGLSAAMLSEALYGDVDHVVTARAEVSRLRRLLGTVVATRPYRMADGVDLRLELGGAERLRDCPFVRNTAAPGLRRRTARAGAGS
ncbi:transcriptional regulator [Amycolatopsis sp. H20-H5]|uniref:transcriptional regulator n=1 Tax=Amycolatopsis sp. H20-H5 TaxID=3046309 RepID=UPI002DBE12F4|nr:transcriptional regulator [Amycolatopsis sp. H20-H5]MEC3980572.1 transcriptional regulator [Amycolatopsis sp. H20-H5]